MKPKILIVDDEESISELLRQILVISGFDASVAKNANEFRALALTQKPQAIILDILLGEDYGPAVYAQLLEEGLDKNIPVIVLSALIDDKPLLALQGNPRHVFFSKPFDYHEVVRKLREFVKAEP